MYNKVILYIYDIKFDSYILYIQFSGITYIYIYMCI